MRTFILFMRKARTDNKFNIEDMPGSGGRIDLAARCVNSALWISHNMRDDSEIYCILNGPSNPPVTIRFGREIKRVSPDERSIGIWIKKALSEDFGKEWHIMNNGIMVARKSFQDVIKEMKDRPIYVLHEKGKKVSKFKKDSVIVLGDHLGIPSKDEKFALRNGEKISLGKTSYLASSCISIVNWMIDEDA